MSHPYRLGLVVSALVAASCAAVEDREPTEGRAESGGEGTPEAAPYVIWQQSAQCIITKSLKPAIKMCVTGYGDLTRARQLTEKSLMQWLDAVRDLHAGVATKVEFDCSEPDGRLVVDNSGEYAYAGEIHLRSSSAAGTYLHEFGHAFACLGDTYVSGTAGHCAQGQPHSIMCDGLLREDLSDDDIAGVRAQFLAMVGTDGGGGEEPGPGSDPDTGNDPGDGGGNKPVVNPNDGDGDGVPNKEDRCTETPAGSHVWGPGQWYGCAAGEYVNNTSAGDSGEGSGEGSGGGSDGDSDEDGVADADDRCEHTPAEAWVWTHQYDGYWMGCAPGETPTK